MHLVQAVSIIREEFLMGQCNLYVKAEFTSVKSTSLEPYKGVYQRLIITQYEVITVSPLYNNIRYNSKIRYNINLVCIKISGSCIFSLISHFILQENIHFVHLLESPC